MAEFDEHEPRERAEDGYDFSGVDDRAGALKTRGVVVVALLLVLFGGCGGVLAWIYLAGSITPVR